MNDAAVAIERRGHALKRFRSVLAILVLAVPALSGCLGVGRTEWAFDAIQADALAKRGLSGQGVVVGIVDTGIDASHPALEHAKIDAWQDFLNGRAEPYDDVGHGTHVAGIIAAKGDWKGWFYGADLNGVAPDVSLVVVKACREKDCDTAAVVNGIDFATGRGVDVLVLSLGGEAALVNLGPDANGAVKRATDRGVVVVVAAGNCAAAEDPCTDVESPSDETTAIAVGAVDEDRKVAPFSARGDDFENYGVDEPGGGLLPVGGVDDAQRKSPNKKPEVVAPGVKILSTYRDGKYAYATGTSQAAPFVGGIVALMLEAKPEYQQGGAKSGAGGVLAIKTALTETALKSDGQREPHDPAYGYGLVQGLEALNRLP